MAQKTLGQLVAETHRLVDPQQRTMTMYLSADVLNTDVIGGNPPISTLSFSDPGHNQDALLPGVIISVDYELMLVVSSPSAGAVTVQRMYLGSPLQSHYSGSPFYVRRQYNDFDIFRAINNDLNDLTAQGLYTVRSTQIAYNPVVQAYDLTGIYQGTEGDFSTDDSLVKIMAVRYQTPLPDRIWHSIPSSQWEVVPMGSTTNSAFTSGFQLILNGRGWPGLPMQIIYASAFFPFLPLFDTGMMNAQLCSDVTGLPQSAQDLPPLGAMINLTQPGEIGRNKLTSQPDTRLAAEVPPGAVGASANPLVTLRMNRISQERSRLKRKYGHFSVRW